MTTQIQQARRLLAASQVAIDALRRLAPVLGQEAACIVLNIADLLDGARGDGAAALSGCDAEFAQHISEQIANMAARAPKSSTPKRQKRAGVATLH